MDEVGEDKPEGTPVKTVTEEAVTAVRRSGRENAGKNGAALQLARAGEAVAADGHKKRGHSVDGIDLSRLRNVVCDQLRLVVFVAYFTFYFIYEKKAKTKPSPENVDHKDPTLSIDGLVSCDTDTRRVS